ncbi:unnamed protein product [Orchesella dallaii]|uniref:Uncharacterized protein n=1 Tax=Orchesella dallaii TaxID=48710 RepID=A0ABP1PHK2_9HEXA
MAKCALIFTIIFAAALTDSLSSELLGLPTPSVCTTPPYCDSTITNTCGTTQKIFQDYCKYFWTSVGGEGALKCCTGASGVSVCKCCNLPADACKFCFYWDEILHANEKLISEGNSTIS